MELLFRKYFWTVELACLALAAFLCAKIANGLIETRLLPPIDTQIEAPAPQRPATTTGRSAQLNLERTARLLGIELPTENPVEEAPPQPAYDPDAAPVRTSLRLSLIGTMVAAGHQEWSMATIRDDNSRETGLYLTGDSIQGAEILEIERLRVILLNNGRKEYLAVEGSGPPPLPQAPVATAVAPAAAEPDSGGADVRQIDENTYEISRSEIDKQLSNLSAIATQARIVPSFKNGVANGFKLFSIRPGSLYQKIGVQNGDVIRKINGYEINSPDKALEVYSKLKEASKIEIELERRGKVHNKTYNIR